jgi:hypothetical protein
MNTSKPIQIFKPGKHVAMSGAALSFSEADLAATAKAYDPAKHEAPLVVGHPMHDAPAYGWVKSLAFADGLNAEPIQVDPAFAEMVGNGAFKKISASFYAPDSPNNPVPGVYYLRHVGFLGAQPPAVKGLRNPSFAETEKGVVEFSEYDDVTNASLWRRLRDWLIGEKGLDVADNIIPDYQVSSLEQAARDEVKQDQTESTGGTTPAFAESKPKGDEMSAEEKTELARLRAENETFKADQIAFAESEKKRKADARYADHIAFAEGLVKDGKLLPAHKDVTVAMLDNLGNQDAVVEFGEGDAKKPLVDAYKAQMQAAHKIVEFGEKAGGKGATGDGELSAEALAAKAIKFQEGESKAGRVVTTAQAVQHVSRAAAKA